jgi:hypothetical protein
MEPLGGGEQNNVEVRSIRRRRKEEQQKGIHSKGCRLQCGGLALNLGLELTRHENDLVSTRRLCEE